MIHVRDVMKRGAVIAKLDDKVLKISKALTEKKINNVPVVDSKGKLVGIVSEKDILKAMESKKFMKMTAKDVMTKAVFSVKENDSLEYVAKIFTEKPYRRIPVTNKKKVVGVIARDDIIQSFMSDYY